MLNRKIISAFLLIIYFLSANFINLSNSLAIENGELSLGDNVVTFVKRMGENGPITFGPVCSAGVIGPRIVATAKHCLQEFNNGDSNLVDKTFEVTFPGSDLRNNNFKSAKILNFIASSGDFRSTEDIALVLVDKDLPIQKNVKVATLEDLARFKEAEVTVFTLGYGANADSNAQSLLPYKLQSTFTKSLPFSPISPQTLYFKYQSKLSYICGGDSGGPNYVIEQDTAFYVAATGFATRPGCAKGIVGEFYSGGNSLAYFPELIKSAEEQVKLQKVLTDKPIIVNVKITCTKGKLIKYVVGKNPKCPSGYKLETKK